MTMIPTILLLLTTGDPQIGTARAMCPAASLQIRVTDRIGRPLKSARVKFDGASHREGRTDAAGCATFNKVRAGKYLLHVERNAFIAFEKEFTVVSGRPSFVPAALSTAVRTPAPAVRASRD